jgi:DNA mismatch repair protein MutS
VGGCQRGWLAKRSPVTLTTESILEELRGTDVNETPPVELLMKVQEWQRRLDRE